MNAVTDAILTGIGCLLALMAGAAVFAACMLSSRISQARGE